MGVNNKKGVMKTSWGKPVHVIAFIRTLLIVLAVAVCAVAAEDVETVRKKAEAGDAFAQNNLGLMYYHGEDVPQDYAEAIKWYRKAAEQGYPPAQFLLGWMHAKGDGVPQDAAEAVKWWRKAAEQGHAYAQTIFGLMYYNGEGVPQDYAEAMKWYRKAAEQGHVEAQYNLGIMTDRGLLSELLKDGRRRTNIKNLLFHLK
jgi:TPR repeat protein